MKKDDKKLLSWSNVIMVVVILIHDADHFRQAICWSYTIPLSVKLVNLLVYAPSLVAFYLALLGKKLSAPATSVNGLFIATAFASVHLSGASILPYWGIWNKSFFLLQVDSISWAILLVTIAAGVGLAIVGSFVAGRYSIESRQEKRPS